MLPHAYGLSAALLLVLGGALSCVAGYRLFKIVLGIYGFILGAAAASSMMGASHATAMIAAAVIGGIAGALILVCAYFIGTALVGAGLGALLAHAGWSSFHSGDPPVALVIVLAVLGAVAAMWLRRYVIIVATAFGGALTVITGGLALAGDHGAARAASGADVWILYPVTSAPGQSWVPAAWILLGVMGTAVQLGLTGSKKR